MFFFLSLLSVATFYKQIFNFNDENDELTEELLKETYKDEELLKETCKDEELSYPPADTTDTLNNLD